MRLLLLVLLVPSVLCAAVREVGTGQTYTTIAAAVTAASASDTINIHAGTYTENPTFNKANLIVQANTGDTPTISGNVTFSANNVSLNGVIITNCASGQHGVYIYNLTAATVTNCTIHTPAAISGSQSGIYCRNTPNVLFSGNTIYGFTRGVNVVSSHPSDTSTETTSYATGTRVLNNTIHDNSVDGIDVHGTYISIGGNTILDNIATDWAATHPDGIQLISSSVDGYTTVQNCRIYNNVVRNHTQNIFTEGNTTGDGSDCDEIFIWNNVCYNTNGTVNGVNMEAIATKHIIVQGTRDCYIFNNTLGRCTNTGILVQEASTSGLVYIKNNIIATETGTGVWAEVASFVDAGALNYNCYGSNDDDFKIGSTYYNGAAGGSQEANGIFTDPALAAMPTPSILSTSPCYNAGESQSALYASDIIGTLRPQSSAWDIGAYEYFPPPNQPTGRAFGIPRIRF